MMSPLSVGESYRIRIAQYLMRRSMPMKPDILAVGKPAPSLEDRLRQAYSLHDCLQPSGTGSDPIAAKVRGIVARASSAVTRDIIAQLPNLGIISVFGVGYERIDVAAAHDRGVVVTNTPGVLTDDVADTAMGLILCV